MADEVRAKDGLLVLGDNQLRTLALLIRNQELPVMRSMDSEVDRVKFLGEVNGAYTDLVSILDTAVDLRKKNEGMARATDIASDIQDYVIYGINWSLQCVKNTGMRKSCIEKLKAHVDDLATDLSDANNIDVLAEEVPYFKNTMFEYANSFRSAKARARSREYSMWLAREGIEFSALVNRHKNRLGFKDEFQVLEEDQKLEVYNSVIVESGRAAIPAFSKARHTQRKTTPGDFVSSVAMLGITAGMMAWDIYTAEHTLEAVITSAVSALVELGSFAVGIAVKSSVTAVMVKGGLVLVSVAGFLAGAVAGILFAVASGALLGVILGSGGNDAPNLDGIRFQSVTLPDGLALAYELSHMS